MKWRVSYILNGKQHNFRNLSVASARQLFIIIPYITGATFISKMREVV